MDTVAETLAEEQTEAADLTLSARKEQREALPSQSRKSSPIDNPAVLTTDAEFERQPANMAQQIEHSQKVARKLPHLPAQLTPTVPTQSTNGTTQKRGRGRPPGSKTRDDAPSKKLGYKHGNLKEKQKEKKRKREEEEERQAGAQLLIDFQRQPVNFEHPTEKDDA